MKKNEERRHAAYGAIAAIVALIAVIGLTARQANGWNQFFGLQSSFLTVFLSFLGVVVVILFAAFCVGVALSNRPRRRQNRVVILNNHWYTRLGILLRRRRP